MYICMPCFYRWMDSGLTFELFIRDAQTPSPPCRHLNSEEGWIKFKCTRNQVIIVTPVTR